MTQTFDVNNELLLTFLPQSLCFNNYKISEVSSNGSVFDINLPVLETFYIENADQYPSVP